MTSGTVVVVGGAGVDVKASPAGALARATSNPGRVRLSAGGAARNVAENLARLGERVKLVAAVGDDPLADLVLGPTAAAGVDVTGVRRVAAPTGVYAAVLAGGELEVAVAQQGAAEALTPADLSREAATLRDAACVVLDANLLPETASEAARLARGVPLCLLPTSAAKAPRLAPLLPLAGLCVLSAREAAVLTGQPAAGDSDRGLAVARAVARLGARAVVLTLGPAGLGWWSEAGGWWQAALPARVVDATGAGDAAAAAAVWAWRRKLEPPRVLRLAAAAAALTVASEETVAPQLGPEVLEAHGR